MINDGTGLGFGIIGGQQTGVVVKTILPGGVADRDGRLLPGDFILQINQQWLKGVASEQVRLILRLKGQSREIDQAVFDIIYSSRPSKEPELGFEFF